MSESMALSLDEGLLEHTETEDFKFNLLALNRREKLLMRCLKADPGKVFVSVDLSSGEPTISTHFSQDPNYYDACFGMVGKEPYYKDGLLKIGDIYLTVMSVSPVGRDRMAEVFKYGVDGVPFIEQWMKDPEVVQKVWLKKERALHKTLALGLGYGMSSAKKISLNALKAGHILSLADATSFKRAYWDIFKVLKLFDTKLIHMWKRDGHVVNPFGYRCLPDADYKVMNSFIQSSVSGVMNLLCLKFFSACHWAKFIGLIHDEILMEIPADKVEETRKIMAAATKSLNEDLGWSVDIRTGWVVGKDMFDAK
jgi:DNA polymerase I-like protein with 3'-5' exonuclease and polymerase domains